MGGLISTAIAWIAWVVAVRPRVVLSENSVEVRNWVTETVIPYCRITRVRTNDGLVFELKDGTELRGRVVGASIIGQFGGYPSAKRLRRAIQPFLGSGELLEGVEVREKISLSLSIPFIIMVLHAFCYGILKFIFHVS